ITVENKQRLFHHASVSRTGWSWVGEGRTGGGGGAGPSNSRNAADLGTAAVKDLDLQIFTDSHAYLQREGIVGVEIAFDVGDLRIADVPDPNDGSRRRSVDGVANRRLVNRATLQVRHRRREVDPAGATAARQPKPKEHQAGKAFQILEK